MQPYLFPYLGYFKLVRSVDRFVFFDDVNFVRRGWVNRNRLLLSGRVCYFTAPLVGASQNVRICDIRVSYEVDWIKKLETSIRQSYGKAPYFREVFRLLAVSLFDREASIGEMAKKSVVAVSRYLGLSTEFVWSSSQYQNQVLKGEERLLDICAQEEAGVYCNLPGGKSIYDKELFRKRGVELIFMEPKLHEYPQFSSVFQPSLSIIDVLMHNDRGVVGRMLE